MRDQRFVGTGVAMITPFDFNGNIDFEAITRILNHIEQGGIDYLVTLGTTAETPTLSKKERLAVLDHVFNSVGGQMPIAIGAGGNNTAEVIDWINEIDRYPHSGLLSVAPYYNKPSQAGLNAHFSAIAQSTDRPIILYNVPFRTSSNLEPATTLDLAYRFDHITCIKEASGNLAQVMAIQAQKPDDFYIVSGDDALTLPLMALGAKGVISVLGQAYPHEFSAMVSAMLHGNVSAARDLHFHILDIMNAIYLEGNPAGVKALMELMGLCGRDVRLPLVQASSDLVEKLKANMPT
ncbi:MAG: 4-hydroxy-tetrahydrodipicolinate synthase [Bacteroidetes bacterium]|jgi:4-hydroxy-tetrahydrodipicolinate synthase|nr:4-hydroxy-tetrahydrodipicolinate synthase [Bacteroidota bacterium]